jgi:hypothetical protein
LTEEDTVSEKAEGIISELRNMQGEFAQLSELEEMERNYAEKLVDSLKVIQSVVDEPIPVERASLGPRYKYVKEAYLASDAVVVLMNASGIHSALPLARFKSSEILSIVQSATPQLKKVIAQKRKDTGDRVELLERILKEIKKAGSTVKQQTPEFKPQEEVDLVSSSITAE